MEAECCLHVPVSFVIIPIMKLIRESIYRKDLKEMAEKSFGNLVKGVVDIRQKVMVVDASLHSDEEALLLSEGSVQSDLWGINLYPDLDGEDFIEFDSMINLRPGQGNNTRGVDDQNIRTQIIALVSSLIK